MLNQIGTKHKKQLTEIETKDTTRMCSNYTDAPFAQSFLCLVDRENGVKSLIWY